MDVLAPMQMSGHLGVKMAGHDPDRKIAVIAYL
jgi:hypothetical protein